MRIPRLSSGREGNTLIPVVAIIFAVLAAVAVVYFGFMQGVLNMNEDGNVNTAVVTNRNVNSVTNTNNALDVTKDWKTFRDSRDRYTFKYPSEATVTEREGAPSIQIKNGGFGISFTNFLFDPNIPGEFILAETLNISGRTWYVAKAGDGPCSWDQIITNTDTYSLNIRASQCTNNDIIEQNIFRTNTELRNALLSTFTFISSTTGWKTYTNTGYNYSIKYPSEFVVGASCHMSPGSNITIDNCGLIDITSNDNYKGTGVCAEERQRFGIEIISTQLNFDSFYKQTVDLNRARSYLTSEPRQTTISGEQAYIFSVNDGYQTPNGYNLECQNTDKFFISKNGNIYEISYVKAVSEFADMLFTFTFTK